MKNLDTALTIHAGVKGINELKRLSDEIKAAGTATDSLDKAADELEKSWKTLSTDEQTKRVKALSDEFKRLKSLSDTKIAVGLTDYQKTQGELAKLKQQFELLKNSGTLSKKELKIATESYHAKVKELNGELSKTPAQVSSLTKGVGGLMSALGVSVGLSEVVKLSDEFNTLESRIKLATQSGGDFNSAMAAIKEIADSTTMPLTATGDLFAKLTGATKELGLSQHEVLELTRTINQAMAVSGGSADSMNAAITQLAQGLSAGALRGDEFNSVVEQSPRLAQALAEGLGVGIGQLREMAFEGKLTAEVVADALKSQTQTIAQEYAQLPKTVSGSLTVLKNTLLGFVGELDNELNSSSKLATIIQGISDGIKTLDDGAIVGLKDALSALGIIANTLYEQVMLTAEGVQSLINAFAGISSTDEQVSFLTRTMQGLAIATGTVADGISAIQIVIQTVSGYVVREVGRMVYAFSLITGQGKTMANELIAQGDELLQSAKQNAQDFESAAKAALDNTTKTQAQRLQESADAARATYEQMAADGAASLEQLQNAFIDYAQKAIQANNGVVDSTLKQALAERNLQAVVNETGNVTVTAMNAIKSATEDIDLSKYAESFRALGVDMGEFATGVNSKLSTALSAFNELAGIAKDNIGQLAIAYNGAANAMATHSDGLNQLDNALLQAVNNNKELANAVKATAAAQKDANSASADQKKALDALGVSIDAINAKMSSSGYNMVQTLQVGLTAIKAQAQGADALKVALAQALDTSLSAAKTQADFGAIKHAIDSAGLSAQVSAAHTKVLQAGMSGGAAAVHALKTTTEHTTAATTKHTQALTDNTHATKTNSAAKQALADSTTQAVDATDKLNKATQQSGVHFPAAVANTRAQVQALTSLGASADKVGLAMSTMYQKIAGHHGSMTGLADAIGRVNADIQAQVLGFKQAKKAVDDASASLSSATVTMDDVSRAQSALARATNASVNGIRLMDSQTLDRLKQQIDSAKQRLQSLADSAKTTADSLEAELARLKGDDITALRLEHTKQLSELEAKLNYAKKRGNRDEIAQLQRALSLQKQIHQEQLKKTQAEATSASTTHSTTTVSTTILASDTQDATVKKIVDSWDERLQQVEGLALERFARQLQDEIKRRPR